MLQKALKSSDDYLQKAKDALMMFPKSLEKEILNEVVDFVKKQGILNLIHLIPPILFITNFISRKTN